MDGPEQNFLLHCFDRSNQTLFFGIPKTSAGFQLEFCFERVVLFRICLGPAFFSVSFEYFLQITFVA